MNMFLHELKSYRKSTLIWTFSLILLICFFFSMFPMISNDADQFKKLLEGYPESVQKAFGISIDMVTSLLGYYSYMFGFILLCGSIQAMNMGTSILSKEVREKTADFLLTKPVTRNQIMTAKLLASLACLLITDGIVIVAAGLIADVVSDKAFDMNIFMLISISAFFVQIMFLTLGMIISVIVSKIKSVLPLSLSIVFAFYIVSMFGSVIGEKAIRYFTPFKYYDTAYIMKNSHYESSFIIVEIVFVLATTIASYWIYSKKDIHAV